MGRSDLKIETPSDTEIVMHRSFDAPARLVWDAYTKPELVKRWLGVFDRWWLDVCEIDLRPGGRYRYVWRGPDGASMGMGGVYLEVAKPEKIVASEKFDQAWYEGDMTGTTLFAEQGGRTTVTTRLKYASKEVRDGVLRSPMADGMAGGFDTLATVLASLAGGEEARR